ncbi:26S proteasome regulatory complex, non-ATPase subcomplex, Rpn2/Psmd1 subunit [Nadsonia fulvescens var. elongata DSM 6958]|uniref:26S proteasome regulatory subunit RPN2 n=1 Tax=Nadsonia fulvescens var. elongata DSM 6958 TaxID=857566 RepID=A0A1E3PSI2_9ASCO|nr:26S proteasome regulatory complex, non-ATPase subcomplex, Rpn2/Psmd1 subunit [Nadsonia fulvescens var. elongata DSM 6958]
MASTSAAPLLALLDEPDYDIKTYALESLDKQVDQWWAEIADYVSQIEELYEDSKFPAPQLAALIASKVYYNLGEFDTSMKFALAAGDQFDFNDKSEYAETIVSKCISHYILVAKQLNDNPDDKESSTVDPKITVIVEKMIQKSIENGEFQVAIGVAIESRRLDIIETIFQNISSQSASELIGYLLDCSINIIDKRQFRNKSLNALTSIILSQENPDYFALCKIIVQLNDYNLAIRIFNDLFSSTKEDSELIAFQVAFDLVASASQELLEKVSIAFDENNSASDTSRKIQYNAKLVRILSGLPTCDYDITFLQKNNNTDLAILNKTKSFLDGRNSVFHSAVTFENAFLHVGTTADSFFRRNLDWLSKATNWTKFSATAALGVIHRGNLTQGQKLLGPYLPGSQGSVYTQGGSLFGLGLIFAGHGREIIDYLRQHISETSEFGSMAANNGEDGEVVLHGACLGVGVAGMSSGNQGIYEDLRNILFSDKAIAGEAAGLAMGLVMLGSANEEAQEEMLQYAHDTQHEKIIRGLSIGMALLMFGKEEAAEYLIERLINETDPILRYGGAYTIAMAYAGTGNNKAIKRLLHIAVSDSSDDVRRAAVTSLGFILLRNYTAVPRMVELLSESHNPHVRYGTTMALGIACAGTGLKEAINVLEPLVKDPVDFVRQGAMMSLAMILIQQTETSCPRVKKFRETFASVVADKHEDAMAKFGAALAQGIIDAGGRNVTIQLENNQTGALNTKAIVGLFVSLQFWNWFPLTHFMSLSFTPTSIIAIQDDLRVPQIQLNCYGKSTSFEYPPKVIEQVSKAPEKLETAVLSTTNKAKARAKKNEKEKQQKEKEDNEDENMNIDSKIVEEKKEENSNTSGSDTVVPTTTSRSSDATSTATLATKTTTPKSFKVDNMTRVLPNQIKYISFPKDSSSKYLPIIGKVRNNGIVILKKTTNFNAGAKVEFIKTVRQINNPEEFEVEAPLPEPFDYETDSEE